MPGKKKMGFIEEGVDETFASYRKKLADRKGSGPTLSEYSALDGLKAMDEASNRADTEGLKNLSKPPPGSDPYPANLQKNFKRRIEMSEKVNRAAKAAYGTPKK